jgi:plasmid stability protein
MAQLSIRLDDALAAQVKTRSEALGRSVNGWVVAVLQAAVDPELAGSEAERTRERLRRAGLLVEPERAARRAPVDQARVRSARRAAGAGKRLSELVSDERR